MAFAQLCKTCQQLEDPEKILEWAPDRRWGRDMWAYDDKWPGLPLLKASAESGCDFCGLLRRSLLSDSAKRSPRPNEILTSASIEIYRESEVYPSKEGEFLKVFGFVATLYGFEPGFHGSLERTHLETGRFPVWVTESQVNVRLSLMNSIPKSFGALRSLADHSRTSLSQMQILCHSVLHHQPRSFRSEIFVSLQALLPLIKVSAWMGSMLSCRQGSWISERILLSLKKCT